jgi:hypothetical protein
MLASSSFSSASNWEDRGVGARRIDLVCHLVDNRIQAVRVCLSNNAAERTLRDIALGRKSWLFCGSDRGGDRAAVM